MDPEVTAWQSLAWYAAAAFALAAALAIGGNVVGFVRAWRIQRTDPRLLRARVVELHARAEDLEAQADRLGHAADQILADCVPTPRLQAVADARRRDAAALYRVATRLRRLEGEYLLALQHVGGKRR